MQDSVLCVCAWLLAPGREAMLVAGMGLLSIAGLGLVVLCLTVGVSCKALLALSSIAFVFAEDRAWPLESVARFACVA